MDYRDLRRKILATRLKHETPAKLLELAAEADIPQGLPATPSDAIDWAEAVQPLIVEVFRRFALEHVTPEEALVVACGGIVRAVEQQAGLHAASAVRDLFQDLLRANSPDLKAEAWQAYRGRVHFIDDIARSAEADPRANAGRAAQPIEGVELGTAFVEHTMAPFREAKTRGGGSDS